MTDVCTPEMSLIRERVMALNKKSYRNAAAAGVLLLAAAAGGVLYARRSVSGKEVAVYPVSAAGYMFEGAGTSISGQVTDSASQEVRKSAELVDSVPVRIGTKVKKGDVLLKYDKESVRLAVESDKASISLLEAQIESANAEISRLQSLHASEEMPEPYEEVIHHTADPVATTASVDTGTAPSEEGGVYYCTKDTVVTADMLKQLDDMDGTAEFVLYDGNAEVGRWILDGSKMSSGEKTVYITREIERTLPFQPEPEAPEDPDEQNGEQTDHADPELPDGTSDGVPEQTGGTEESEEVPSEQVTETKTEEMAPYEDWTLGDGVEFNGDGTVTVDYGKKHYGTLVSVVPQETEWDETVFIDPAADISGDDYSYTRAELAEEVKNKQKEIKEKEIALKEAELKLKEDQLVSSDGSVKASMDGVVTEVKDPAEVKTGETLITVKGESGCTVTAYLSEYDIRTLQKGEALQVTSYETGSSFTAEVTDISLEPDNTNMWGSSHVTYYPVTAAAVDQNLKLNRGEYCMIQRLEGNRETDTFCLEPMFIRKDDQGSYCMIADENDRLKKVYIRTGRSQWGSVEILDGITMEDRIAFPYGKSVKEGSPVVDKDTWYE